MTTISISTPLKEELKELGSKSDTYEDIIKRNINFVKKFANEDDFHFWFEFNYQLCGFDEIIKSNKRSFPDFIVSKGGKEIRLELEIASSNFLWHKHNPNEVDLVLCLIKDKALPVETVEISPFKYVGKASLKTITISENTLDLYNKIHFYLQNKYRHNGNFKRITHDEVMREILKDSTSLVKKAIKYDEDYSKLIEEVRKKEIGDIDLLNKVQYIENNENKESI